MKLAQRDTAGISRPAAGLEVIVKKLKAARELPDVPPAPTGGRESTGAQRFLEPLTRARVPRPGIGRRAS